MKISRTNPGFSLIELMTVLLITGLLLTLAWPSYQSHVRRGHRVEAATALMEAQHFMERYYAVQGRYTTATGSAPALPLRLQTVPAQGTVRYRLKLEGVEAGKYTLHADPHDALAVDACGSLTLASTGAKGRTGSGLTVQQCWQ
jgi:type IV pilus assembly protein PilE